jgi:hypothetical protein
MDSSTKSLIPCTFFLPLAYNDGQPVEQERLEALLDAVFVEFGGYTREGKQQGAYRRQDDGSKQVEFTEKIRVAVEGQEGVAKLKAMVAEIGSELGQECMYFEVSAGSTVELVPSKKKGGR